MRPDRRPLTSPWLIATASPSIGAFLLLPGALESGRPMPVIALIGAGNEVISEHWRGWSLFADPLGHEAVTELAHLAAFVLIVIAAWLLAPAQAAVTVPARARTELRPRH